MPLTETEKGALLPFSLATLPGHAPSTSSPSSAVFGLNLPAPLARIPRIQEAMEIGRRLDETAWNQALVIETNRFELRTECLPDVRPGAISSPVSSAGSPVDPRARNRPGRAPRSEFSVPSTTRQEEFQFQRQPLGSKRAPARLQVRGCSVRPPCSRRKQWDGQGRITENDLRGGLAVPFRPRCAFRGFVMIATGPGPGSVMHKIRSVPRGHRQELFFLSGTAG